ncbi:hypothetical protein Sez_0273 [Streptococcus equi subsp. zooepidemicus MGCS10565]|uniref:Uncharacterized protein n=1 Tax=Streptococcus equi subsp. zooepidemicus (strain MGCS10565) TaxID=552526 RepID=B4U0W4_STREM|nr:hypothetical protein Sez_0273 [Streptococcus equi subsp. zooepidemicus MGCS10565]
MNESEKGAMWVPFSAFCFRLIVSLLDVKTGFMQVSEPLLGML